MLFFSSCWRHATAHRLLGLGPPASVLIFRTCVLLYACEYVLAQGDQARARLTTAAIAAPALLGVNLEANNASPLFISPAADRPAGRLLFRRRAPGPNYARAQARLPRATTTKAKLEIAQRCRLTPSTPGPLPVAQLAEREQNWREMFGNLANGGRPGPQLHRGPHQARPAVLPRSLRPGPGTADAVLALDANSADGHTCAAACYRRAITPPR